ncbi:MAG TPA: response regulator [Candidatus Babeliaceae bacterium]|nr:response regulator [Candidatus Babeliaceae bacterium]HVZ97875.1 response regulator [Chitinophagaceae bacterium]
MKKILVMEDNELIRENIAEMLELANYKTFTAENGKAGVELALSQHPDLIVCDVMMPVLDGYGALHLLSKNESTKNIPFIFLTSRSDKTDIRKGMELGADDYITKPFDNVELLNAIDRRLKKVESLKEEIASELNTSFHSIDTKSSDEALMEFISGRNTNKYKRKQQIFSEGNRPIYLFYVLKGKVKTFKTNDSGKELVLDLYKQDDFLGQVSLLEDTNYKETAEALEETELALIPRDEFESLINNSPQVSRKFIQMLAKNVTEKEEQLLGLAYNSLRKRVAETLLLLYRKYGASGSPAFSIDINRNNLANIAGVAKESFIRTLREFKDEKLIGIKDGIIVITNRQRLENLLN